MPRTHPSERFRAKVDASAGPDACHPWTGAGHGQGYGTFHLDGRTVLAHRFAWELEKGPLPARAHVDHVCHNGSGCPGGRTCPHRRCCNVRHLDATTPVDNLDRSHLAPQHREECPSGHAYTVENTRLRLDRYGRESRICRECHRARERERKRSQRATARNRAVAATL